MAVGRHVDGHAVDLDGQIGAVVEVEAAQKILVGFARAGMLGGDQPGTTSNASPGREKGWAFTSTPLMVMALAAVGCMYAGPAVADPDVTPLLTCVGTGALGWTADGFRALLSRRGGLVRLRGLASGGFTVTAGSCPGAGVVTSCASAGDTMTNRDAAAENVRQAVLPTLMPPHDNCYNHRTTVSVRLNPRLTLASEV
jgi:hypothetical protein